MSWPSAARRLLLPLNPAYGLALVLREVRLRSGLEPVRKLHWPVVSVGSLSAGGAGKTPMTIALARALAGAGIQVDVLSRGYGRKSREPSCVRPDGAADEFGDEPLLIARATGVPVYVAAQRYQAGLMAEAGTPIEEESPGRPVLHLLDDGFQHRQLARDVDILLVNQADWRDRLLPAGNLREPRNAARRASVIAIPADESEFEGELRAWGWRGPIWRLRRAMELPAVDGPVAAFCGIARPEQFFSGLEGAGMRVLVRTAFPDHHQYSVSEIEGIVSSARAAGVTALLTTEKDRVRMGAAAANLPSSLPLMTAGLRIDIDDEAIEWLQNSLLNLLPGAPDRVNPASPSGTALP